MTYKTKGKELVRAFLAENKNKNVSLEQICEWVTAQGCGRSTVYRIVSLMVREGSLMRICDDMTRHVSYRYIEGQDCSEHMHLKCKGCGVLIHLDKATSLELGASVFKKRGFSLDTGAMLLGVCRDCCKRNMLSEVRA